MFLMKPQSYLSLLTAFMLPLAAVQATPIITEFMASGSDAPADADGDTPDWIEIYNPDDAAVALAGYGLTDDQEMLQKWSFPEVTIESKGYLIVFASNKDRTSGELHSNFELNGGGEYLALSAPDGTILSEFTYPEQRGDVSYGFFNEELQFFQEATPSEANESGIDGFVADTKFSVNRGFYDESFVLEITTETAGATIFYSIDGTDPAKGSLFNPAEEYTEPLTIPTTTVVRAIAKKSGWQSTNTDTHTYIFHNDVVNQSDQPDGFPERWGSHRSDYEMDPRITGPNADKMIDSLRFLPTISFVGDVSDFFGSKGIYTNSTSHGIEWERPISFEWINPDGSSKFQVDCGVRLQGGAFRNYSLTDKKSFRLLFKNEYGVERLRHDIVNRPGAVSDFDTIIFRAGANDGYAWGAAGTTVQYTRDEFGRRLAHEAGYHSNQGGFQHLYINGVYWGLYNLAQRPNEDFSASYYGGEAGDWDSINSGDVKNAGGAENGNDPNNSGLRDWQQYVRDAKGAETHADYMALQGLNPDGTRNPNLKVYLDQDHYIDYMIMNFWGGNWDWPNKNFWFGRLNTEESTGFKHYMWDFENTMGNNRSRSPLNMNSPRNTQWVGEPYAALRDLLWFQVAWADRTHRLFHNGGILSPEKTRPFYQSVADEVEMAIYAETARWGDDNSGTPHTIEEWRGEREWMLDTYLTQRTGIVLEQFEDRDLFPSKMPPAFNQHGGSVSSGFQLTMEPASKMFYTTDGSDPFTYNENGAIEISDSAVAYADPITIDQTMTVKARFYSKSIFGGITWSALNEATFSVGADKLRITEIMYHPTSPTDAERAAGYTSASVFEYIVLTNTGDQPADLAGIQFTNGISFDFDTLSEKTLAAGATAILVRSRAGFEARYGANHPVIGEYGGKLDDGGERLTLTDAAGQELLSIRYNDKEPWPVEADGQGSSLKLSASQVDENYSNSGNWTAGAAISGGGGNPQPSGLSAWQTENGVTDLLADDDSDQLANIIEYVMATDPKKGNAPGEYLTTSTGEFEVNGATRTYFTVTYVSRVNTAGATISIETSKDLVTWASDGLVTQSKSAIDGTQESVVMRSVNPVSANSPTLYGRLKVTAQ